MGGGGGISTAGSNTTAFGLTAFYGGGGGNVTGAGAGGQTGNSPNTGDSDGQQPTLNQSTLSGGCASPLVVQHGCGSVGCSGGAGAGTTNCNTGDPPPNYVKGGAGVCYSISGSTLWYGGGGGGAWPGGAIPNSPGTSVFGLGGKGGGGHGITGCGSPGLAGASPNVDSAPATCFDGQCAAPFVGQPADILKCGAANRGGGGGGNHHTGTPPYPNGGAGAGGSGVAIIRYPISIS